MEKEIFIVAVPPQRLNELRLSGVIPAHMAYRVGRGPHLLRSGGPVALRGGLMALDSRDCDGSGPAAPFCQEVTRECAARGYGGVVCDFEGEDCPLLKDILRGLAEQFKPRGWTLYVPECYGETVPSAKVLLPSALSGGSLEARVREGCARWGAERVTLALQRCAEDFRLPAPSGCGAPLSREKLEEMRAELHPSVFFSAELCARYFTYRAQDGGAHFVLFDDGDTLRRKLEVARRLGVSTFLAAWSEVDDVCPALGLRGAR